MNRSPLRRASAVAVVALVVICVPGASPASAQRAWRIVPNPSLPGGTLSGVTSISDRDVWAVGWSGGALAEHWAGSAWTVVPTAPLGAPSTFAAVDGAASDDVWAVGSWENPAASPDEWDNLAEHWDGSSWTQIPFPSIATGHSCTFNRIDAVSAVSATDAWAAGSYDFCGSNGGGFAAHWDGTAWTMVNTAPAYTDVLDGAAFVRPSLGWLVGARFDDDAGHDEPMVVRWDGTSWRPTLLSDGDGVLTSVVALSSRDAWAVGGIGRDRPFIVHWNGHRWRRVRPHAGPLGALAGVTARGPRDVTAVGATLNGHTLVLHWDGVSWSRESSPNGTPPSRLLGVTTSPTSRTWAVGQDSAGPLIERRR